jgi:hypothetical protein
MILWVGRYGSIALVKNLLFLGKSHLQNENIRHARSEDKQTINRTTVSYVYHELG